jgi:hypothetical protein
VHRHNKPRSRGCRERCVQAHFDPTTSDSYRRSRVTNGAAGQLQVIPTFEVATHFPRFGRAWRVEDARERANVPAINTGPRIKHQDPRSNRLVNERLGVRPKPFACLVWAKRCPVSALVIDG